MKNVKFKHNYHVFEFILAITMICSAFFSFSLTAFAEESDTTFVDTKSKYVVLSSDSEYYEEALEVLKLTPEEAAECTIFSVDVPMTSPKSRYDPQTYISFNEFSFYDSNVGSYWTCDGNRLKWGFTWHPTYGSNIGQYLEVNLYQYAYPNPTYVESSGRHYDGYNSFTSNWITANRCDYKFYYYTAITAGYGQTAYATVKMFAATKTV